MQVDINLPDDTVRKLKAMNILIGGSDDIEAMLVKMIDEAIVNKIVDTITAGRVTPTVVITHAAVRPRSVGDSEFQDLTGVSDGLGDPEPARATRRRQPTPAQAHVGGVADEELDHDMDVDDPGSEAKVEAPTFADQMGDVSAEEAFATAADMPAPVHVPEANALRRRRATVDKRRVSAFSGAEQDRI